MPRIHGCPFICFGFHVIRSNICLSLSCPNQVSIAFKGRQNFFHFAPSKWSAWKYSLEKDLCWPPAWLNPGGASNPGMDIPKPDTPNTGGGNKGNGICSLKVVT